MHASCSVLQGTNTNQGAFRDWGLNALAKGLLDVWLAREYPKVVVGSAYETLRVLIELQMKDGLVCPLHRRIVVIDRKALLSLGRRDASADLGRLWHAKEACTSPTAQYSGIISLSFGQRNAGSYLVQTSRKVWSCLAGKTARTGLFSRTPEAQLFEQL